jgi:hypothetical protein
MVARVAPGPALATVASSVAVAGPTEDRRCIRQRRNVYDQSDAAGLAGQIASRDLANGPGSGANPPENPDSLTPQSLAGHITTTVLCFLAEYC